ncbi:Uncharacterized protein Fot_42762 [Forsythia ovata]|uniref:Uncharacterized protein n=1 Tax=Forsythia ovata TaxID=205694 RepID=A0ABD1RM39_9LAMI
MYGGTIGRRSRSTELIQFLTHLLHTNPETQITIPKIMKRLEQYGEIINSDETLLTVKLNKVNRGSSIKVLDNNGISLEDKTGVNQGVEAKDLVEGLPDLWKDRPYSTKVL